MAQSEPMAVDSVPVDAVGGGASAAAAPADAPEAAAAPAAEGEASATAGEGEASTSAPFRRKKDLEPQEPVEDVIHRRLTVIKEGDNVLLRLPSDTIKSVVVTKDG